ncbi:MBL fold metallo-hydrolase [Desulfonauticus submarinus]
MNIYLQEKDILTRAGCPQIKITFLIENKSLNSSLLAEHGLSLWVEIGKEKILFDTGSSNKFIQNAKQLGVDLSETKWIILSHGHYDHTGGLAEALKLAPKAKIVLHPNSIVPRYSIEKNSPRKISMPIESKKALLQIKEEQIIWNSGPFRLFQGVGVSGFIPREHLEQDKQNFFEDPKGQRKDIIPDDQTMWINCEDKLILITGCCHAGVLNTLDYLIKITDSPNKPIILIGGLHLYKTPLQNIQKLIQDLKKYNIQTIIPCHCTGDTASQEFSKYFSNTIKAHAGFIWKVEN